MDASQLLWFNGDGKLSRLGIVMVMVMVMLPGKLSLWMKKSNPTVCLYVFAKWSSVKRLHIDATHGKLVTKIPSPISIKTSLLLTLSDSSISQYYYLLE